ncbi:low-specificity L-threonine aldolase (plasmid) [Azospirillum argentinense]|uniref:Low-specificity L-threonine aldolase n=1 Tax=Azospirillum argentinense TaxID=2970906 RepID=A0A4D8PQ14_9PROT|nr:low-specificity L-threonine aldolase [Azospirillum argentinense]QCO00027.1 low-specificity L-threonine aldolase [Azospirillum argentinense]
MIDLISDTVTLPGSGMRAAIYGAEVGDDVYGEDPSTAELECRSADLMGKEAAVFFPTGTMANLCSILAQCSRGQDVYLSDASDIYNFEGGGLSVVGGLVMHPLRTNADGTIDIGHLASELRDPDDIECAPPGLLTIETPNVRNGGVPLPINYLRSLKAFCATRRLPVHMDGARIFNAALALKVEARTIAQHSDSVQFCLSKGLGAPAGSVACGSRDFTARARRWRKMLGGGMRQSGILARAGIYALENNVARLMDDHVNASILAEGLSTIDGIRMDQSSVWTNIVVFEFEDPSVATDTFTHMLAERGVRMSTIAYGRVRAVTHMHITRRDVLDAVEAVRRVMKSLT